MPYAYDLKDLRLFKAVAQARNLAAGAAALNMTASLASYRLKNLEYTAGCPLFVRSPRGMTLTPAGDAMEKHVDTLLGDLNAMHEELSTYATDLHGQVKLLANSSALQGFIVPSVARFLAANSRVDVEIQELGSEAIPGCIRDGEADIGVFAGRVEDADLTCELYAIDRLICATPPAHPLVQRSRASLKDILDNDFVCRDTASSNTQFLFQRAQEIGKPVKARVYAHDFAAMMDLVAAGVGVALVPMSVAESALRDGRVGAVNLLDRWAFRELHLVMKRSSSQSDLAHQFATILMHDPLVVATRSSTHWV
ncbi:LysR family transcriptional regulator [Bordetella bronchialis]|uniref:LysR family transcriptional regulator n=1 Tax=Bordetella bronchialis TaxID=463025 RepID=A0A193FWR4_9BORD|nr:LysR family transcriptional regulator [Bordetella bronchialis]ANN67122.1 LysR family transcriptional regulator [Bordetella bronchialis]ANN72202.1 LysR family transcriptional regulator [Bordetella bronchialis]